MGFNNKRPIDDEFPQDFAVQRIGIASAKSLEDLRPADIASYFREHPEVAKDLLNESYDKRGVPTTYITEAAGGFIVGWVSYPRYKSEYERSFSDLANAATDYLLFSLGKGRWNPTEPQ